MIKQFYSDRESKSLEFKSQLPNFHALVKTCVAFTNGVGGKIVIGVDDKSREIMGINDKIRDRVYDEFPNSLYDDVENCLGVSHNTATRKLNKLIESGKIRREGSGPSVRYFLYEK